MDGSLASSSITSHAPNDTGTSTVVSRVRLLFWTATILVAAFLTWSGWFGFSVDGLSYLDIADAYRRHDWATAINAYWSPLYSWVLALGLGILKPSSYWLFPAIQLINFLISLFALLCFDFLWSGQGEHLRKMTRESEDSQLIVFPRWTWMAVGYTLFIWTITRAIPASEVGADMLVAAIVFLVCGLIARIRAGSTGFGFFALLGFVLGFGYLAKGVMFPLALVFMGVAFLAVGNIRKGTLRTLVALIVFLAVSAPFIGAISRSKGRFTIGDTGKINYAWGVNRSAPFFNWQGGDPTAGTPKHPTRKLLSAPALYEFATPIGGTYPPHYDPSYWNEGIKPHFDVKQQIRTIITGLYACYDAFIVPQSGFIAGVIILLLLGGNRTEVLTRVLKNWHLWLPALVGLGVYILITVTPRNVASFMLLLWVALLSGIRLPDTQVSKRLLAFVTGTVIFLLSLNIAQTLGTRIYEWRERSTNGNWLVAEEMSRLGIRPGDRIASLGSAYNEYFARVAGVKIVAEIPSSDVGMFWAGDSHLKSEVFATFVKTSARAVVTWETPSAVLKTEWQKTGSSPANAAPDKTWQELGDSGYYLHLLTPAEASASIQP